MIEDNKCNWKCILFFSVIIGSILIGAIYSSNVTIKEYEEKSIFCKSLGYNRVVYHSEYYLDNNIFIKCYDVTYIELPNGGIGFNETITGWIKYES
jgi:hypothetical protein